ncbi:hypothetical protein CIPAW_12G035200 [Carya illinoinensis]|uniref:Endonuclease/exonuclease/phosphatase domain-containing protein n=1 Tax=Carya illinoinensis TaxID=32201 RepID=A0A8T1NMK5_CARIL|nr:hypothetical protein CIPAW_12G035200 [Carya illinoinensis]
MKPKILSWNARGLNDIGKRLQVRNLLHGWKPDIVCLQETKLKIVNKKIIRSIWDCVHVDWVYLAAKGASGEVLVMWDK